MKKGKRFLSLLLSLCLTLGLLPGMALAAEGGLPFAERRGTGTMRLFSMSMKRA